jgi:nitroreductase
MSDPQAFLDFIVARHSQRAFLGEPVPRDVLESVLVAAANAPSGKNTQPWRVEVVEGETLAALSQRLCVLFDANTQPTPDYAYCPDPEPPEFVERARACGHAIFSHKGIDRHDRAARREHSRENFLFFNAPLVCIFHLPKPAERGNFLDLGMFMQNIMLGLVAYGFGSCPQASIAGYPDAIRECLGLAENRLVVAGLAAGQPDPDVSVNGFIPLRLPLVKYTQWHS